MRALSEAYLDAVPSPFTFMHCLTFHRFVAALAVLSRREHAATREPNAERLVGNPSIRDDLREDLERILLLMHSGVLGVVYADVHKSTVTRTSIRPANTTRRLMLLAKILDTAQ